MVGVDVYQVVPPKMANFEIYLDTYQVQPACVLLLLMETIGKGFFLSYWMML